MQTPLGPYRTSWSLHRTASTSDVLTVACRHGRATSVLPDPLSRFTEDCPADRRTSRRHARKGMMDESPRTPSVVSTPASPKTRRPNEPLPINRQRSFAHRFAVSPLGSRVSGHRASLGLATWITKKPCDFQMSSVRDVSDRLLPPKRNYVYPHLVCSWFAPQLSLRGSATLWGAVTFATKESWAPCG